MAQAPTRRRPAAQVAPPQAIIPAPEKSLPFASRRKIGGFLKVAAVIIALLSLIFTAYQIYVSNRTKKFELAVAQVEKFQTFAASDSAKRISDQSVNNDRKTYRIADFMDGSTQQFRSLLNFFNLINGVAYLYNLDLLDKEYLTGNLLCPLVKQYRTFVLARSGHHGVVFPSADNSGVFRVGTFKDFDKMIAAWEAAGLNGASVDEACALNWKA